MGQVLTIFRFDPVTLFHEMGEESNLTLSLRSPENIIPASCDKALPILHY